MFRLLLVFGVALGTTFVQPSAYFSKFSNRVCTGYNPMRTKTGATDAIACAKMCWDFGQTCVSFVATRGTTNTITCKFYGACSYAKSTPDVESKHDYYAKDPLIKFLHYPGRKCFPNGTFELGSNTGMSLLTCAETCLANTRCTVFQFKASGGVCKRSTTCTYYDSYKDTTGYSLYVKKLSNTIITNNPTHPNFFEAAGATGGAATSPHSLQAFKFCPHGMYGFDINASVARNLNWQDITALRLGCRSENADKPAQSVEWNSGRKQSDWVKSTLSTGKSQFACAKNAFLGEFRLRTANVMTEWVYEKNYEYVGHTFTAVQRSSATDCQSACASNGACRTFTWIGTQCQMKGVFKSGGRKRAGAVSGYKRERGCYAKVYQHPFGWANNPPVTFRVGHHGLGWLTDRLSATEIQGGSSCFARFFDAYDHQGCLMKAGRWDHGALYNPNRCPVDRADTVTVLHHDYAGAWVPLFKCNEQTKTWKFFFGFNEIKKLAGKAAWVRIRTPGGSLVLSPSSSGFFPMAQLRQGKGLWHAHMDRSGVWMGSADTIWNRRLYSFCQSPWLIDSASHQIWFWACSNYWGLHIFKQKNQANFMCRWTNNNYNHGWGSGSRDIYVELGYNKAQVVNDVQVKCTDTSGQTTTNFKSVASSLQGSWPSTPKKCPDGYAICGFRPITGQFHFVTVMTNMQFMCCEIERLYHCPNGWTLSSNSTDGSANKCFKVIQVNTDWQTAEKHCSSLGADLAAIESFSEQNLVTSLAEKLNAPRVWIGLSSVFVDKKPNNPAQSYKKWSDGSTVKYTNWLAGQPDAQGNAQNCGELRLQGKNYKWEDTNCGNKQFGVCQLRIEGIQFSCDDTIPKKFKELGLTLTQGVLYPIKCPMDCVARPVTGCNPFTMTTKLCTATRALGKNGGVVAVSGVGTRADFISCTQNGIVTDPWDKAADAFEVYGVKCQVKVNRVEVTEIIVSNDKKKWSVTGQTIQASTMAVNYGDLEQKTEVTFTFNQEMSEQFTYEISTERGSSVDQVTESEMAGGFSISGSVTQGFEYDFFKATASTEITIAGSYNQNWNDKSTTAVGYTKTDGSVETKAKSFTSSVTVTHLLSHRIQPHRSQEIIAKAETYIIKMPFSAKLTVHYTCGRDPLKIELDGTATIQGLVNVDQKLDITYKQPILLMPRKVFTPDKTCAANPVCKYMGMDTGDCCPVNQGVGLSQPKWAGAVVHATTTPAPGSNDTAQSPYTRYEVCCAQCGAHSACMETERNRPGEFCCPSRTGVYHSCCPYKLVEGELVENEQVLEAATASLEDKKSTLAFGKVVPVGGLVVMGLVAAFAMLAWARRKSRAMDGYQRIETAAATASM